MLRVGASVAVVVAVGALVWGAAGAALAQGASQRMPAGGIGDYSALMDEAAGRARRTTSSTSDLFVRTAATRAAEALELCAMRSRASLETLRGTGVMVEMRSRGRPSVTLAHGPEGREARALTRCVTQALTRAMGSTRGVPEGTISRLEPFANLTLPMEPAPAAPSTTWDESQVEGLRQTLAAQPSDAARLGALRAVEEAGGSLEVSAAASLLDSFTEERRAAAALLCRVSHGRAVLRALSRPLTRADRTWLRTATRGACGVSAPPQASAPAPAPSGSLPADLAAGCSAASECVLACPAAPDCCGGQCGCDNAILRVHEAAARALCAAAPVQCPPVGCAMESFTVACESGRCVARRARAGGF